jgi:hypothetical protein
VIYCSDADYENASTYTLGKCMKYCFKGVIINTATVQNSDVISDKLNTLLTTHWLSCCTAHITCRVNHWGVHKEHNQMNKSPMGLSSLTVL